mmetsp:Transcript_17985/g.27088  ORF Transcript_17985/g.27088 Transcript_17985/m.27088 type:complete len:82 (+) Transcript_17985:216-461(+)
MMITANYQCGLQPLRLHAWPQFTIQVLLQVVKKLIVGLSRCGPADVQPNLFSDIFCFMSDNFDSILHTGPSCKEGAHELLD